MMRRRYACGILLIIGCAALTLHAEDFWVKKDWKTWTKDEATRMTQDSPWAKQWGQANSVDRTDLNASTTAGVAGESKETIQYIAQIRSALPLRLGIVRLLQIQQKYDKLTEDQKKSFDTQAEAIVNRNYADVILIHVYYNSSTQATARQLAQYWQSIPAESIPVNVYLINEHGLRVSPIRFVSPKSGAYEFEIIFPRMVNNEPVVLAGDKNLRLQFPHPGVGNFSSDLALLEFKIDKMVWEGKPAF
jgi:hypothetical protein